MEAHHEMNRRKTVVKRVIVVAISVLLALVVAAPIASGKSASQSQNLGQLTAELWNWSFSTNPSPLEGSYKGPMQRGVCRGGVLLGRGA
jgi:predicted PurR-regulated permease PerM